MTVAVLRNPNNAEQAGQPAELQEAARTLGLQLLVLNVTTPQEIDTAFATVVQERIGALIVAGDSFLWNRREQIMALAAQHAVPAIYGDRDNQIIAEIRRKTKSTQRGRLAFRLRKPRIVSASLYR
jgi:putative ABC transport system substrate-binding protein